MGKEKFEAMKQVIKAFFSNSKKLAQDLNSDLHRFNYKEEFL